MMAEGFKIPDSFTRRGRGLTSGSDALANPRPFAGLNYADLDDPSGAPERPARKPAFSFKNDLPKDSGDNRGNVVSKPTVTQFSFKRSTAAPAAPRRSPQAQAASAAVKRATRVARRASSNGEDPPSGAPKPTNPPFGGMTKSPFSLKRTVANTAGGKIPGPGGARVGTVPGGGNPFKLVRKAVPLESSKVGDNHEGNSHTQSHLGAVEKSSFGRRGSPFNDKETRVPSPSTERERRPLLERKEKTQMFQPTKLAAGPASKDFVLRQLRNLVGKQCADDFERYQLLDERDKLMCKLRELEPTTRSVGTCPELCSEKERYVRIVQKRLSSYECDERGRLQPEKAIKEYARSAADQERPLPHELRPGPLLVQAMDYLLLEIIDRIPAPEQLHSWYDFLWSRTRAIRKEVTQQMLTDTTAVMLVERCARLHIFASYALCTLDIGEFDQKMNTENLGKSIQTLRHLYEDLEKRGIRCESEAEFRSYDIMMYLHDTNTMTQALSYRKEVRDSEPVRLALQLASALQNNNYVRFFRLLRTRGTFLQVCACHRYFDRMRAGAYQVLVAAYGRNAHLPLDSLCDQLGFDDEEQLICDAAAYGLLTSEDMESLEISKDSFSQYPNDVPELMQYSWIDDKMGGNLLSEVISGGVPVHKFSSARLIDSFDENGVYSRDPVMADVLRKHGINAHISVAEPLPVVQLSEENRQQSEEQRIQMLATNTAQIVQTEIRPLFTKLVEFAVPETLETKLDSIITKEIRLCSAEYKRIEDEKRRTEEEREHAAREKQKAREIVNELTQKLLDEGTELILKRTTRMEYSLSFNVYQNKLSDWFSERVWNSLLCEVVDVQLHHILQDVYDESWEEFQSRLVGVRYRLRSLWIRQFWDQWRQVVIGRRVRREQTARAIENWKPVSKAYIRRSTASSPMSSSCSSTGRRSNERVNTYLNAERHAKTVLLKCRRRERIVRCAFYKWREYAKERGRRSRLFAGFINRKRAQPMYVVPPSHSEHSVHKKTRQRNGKAVSAFSSPLALMGTHIPSFNDRLKRRSLEYTMFPSTVSPRERSSVTPVRDTPSPQLFTFAAPALRNEMNGFSPSPSGSRVTSSGLSTSMTSTSRMEEDLVEGSEVVTERDLNFAREQIDRMGWRPRSPVEKIVTVEDKMDTVEEASSNLSEVRDGISSLTAGIEAIKAQLEEMRARCKT